MTRMPHVHDVVVVGGRCAGAATAMLLARQGWDVGLLERFGSVTDTVSTHGLTRGGVVQLHRWGLLDELVASGAPPVKTLSFRFGDQEIRRTVPGAAPADAVLAPRRHVLDGVLLAAASTAGAKVTLGATVTDVQRDARGRAIGVCGRMTDGAPFSAAARFVVGADGRSSRVARSVGAEVIESSPTRCGTFYSYFDCMAGDEFEFHVGNAALVGVFPTHDGRSCVWLWRDAVTDDWGRRVVVRDAVGLVAEIGNEHPDLARRLDATTAPRVRGVARIANQLRRAAGPGWALVGDAGSYRDPITGHGITDAFRDAELLARTLGAALAGECPERNALTAYEAERIGLGKAIFDLTCDLASHADPRRFLQLGQQLSEAFEAEAQALESFSAPPPARPRVALAARP